MQESLKEADLQNRPPGHVPEEEDVPQSARAEGRSWPPDERREVGIVHELEAPRLV